MPPSDPTVDAADAPACSSRVAKLTGWLSGDRPLAVIVAVQVAWLWWALSSGWFLQADLSNLADSAKHPMGWAYLRRPLGGHFGPVGRLQFWLFDQAGGLNYTVTVVFRVAGAAICTVLLYRLLVLLVGRRPLVPAVVAVYAVNPLLLAGTAYFTSGMGLVSAQVFALLMVIEFVRYARDPRWGRALATGLFLAAATATSDQWIVAVLVPPLLYLVHFASGSLSHRLSSLVARWQHWLLVFVPVAVVVGLQAAFGTPTRAGGFGVADAARLLREAWLRTFAPAWAGGPWRWYANPQDYVSFTAPPGWMMVLGELIFVAVVAAGIQRLGLRSLAAWIMPSACGLAGILIVGYARYGTYGTLLAITPRYATPYVALWAIGATLALAPLAQPDGSPAPVVGGHAGALGRVAGSRRVLAAACAAVIAGVIGLSLASGARFTSRFSASPAEGFVTNLVSSARAFGPQVNLYDTPLPQTVVASIEPSHRVSDLLRLAGLSARFDDPGSEPLVVDGDGRLTKAVFVAGPQVPRAAADQCGTFVHGVGTWTYPLDHPATSAEWFVRLELYQAASSVVTVELVDAAGHVRQPMQGASVRLGTLEARNIAMPMIAPVAVRIHSEDPGTNLCLTRIAIGGPFPVGGHP